MKRAVALVLLIFMTLGLFSCFEPIDPSATSGNGTTLGGNTSSGTTAGGGTGDSTDVKIPDETPDLDAFDPDELAAFEAFFDPENHVSIHLDISDSELKKIQQDYEKYSSMGSKSPIYRMADMYITITKPNGETMEYTIEQVGVRMKGNTSRCNFWDSSSGMYNLVHFKVSFGETFDNTEYYGSSALVWSDDAARQARKDRTFATLEKIDMRWNRNDDPTYIRETYAYELYRENGILAPHTNLASVDIGNDHAGVWVVYEPIDKTFLEKNLSPEALGGDLYKLGWTSEGATFTSFSSYGVEDEDNCQFYVYDLKTNKKTSDHSSLRNLISTLNSSGLTKSSFESVVDVDSFLLFSAVSYIIGNPDDLRNNYNNCYIYFRADTGKMIIIPYDMDRGLGVNTWNPYGNGMTTDSPFQSYNVCGDQRSPLFNKTIQENGFLVNEYITALKIVAESEMLTNEAFEESFNTAKALYAGDTTPSKKYGNAWDHNFSFDINKTCGAGSSSNMSFADYISAKKNTLSRYIDGYTSGDGGSGSGAVETNRELYVRGNFDDNNWQNHEKYKLSHIGDGVYSVTVTATSSSGDAGTFKFKIYDNQSGSWYNTVDDSCAVEFEYQGGNQNIQLQLGTYTIYFYTQTGTIMIEQ